MNAIVESLEKNKDKVKAATFGPNAYTIYLENEDHGIQSRVQGYGPITDTVRDYLKDHKIPALDFTTADPKRTVRFSTSMPLIGDDMRDGPIGGLSKASFEVYANFGRLNGATMYNVREISFIPEMFQRLDNDQREFLKAAYSGNDNRLKESISKLFVANTSVDELWKPMFSGDFSNSISSFNNYLTKILEPKYQEMVNTSIQKEKSSKKYGPLSSENLSLFTEKLAYQKTAKLIRAIANVTTWNALMVQAGNLTEEQAWQETKDFVNKIYEEILFDKEKYSISSHKNIHLAADYIKPIITQFNKVASRFTEAKNDSELTS